MGLTAVRPSWAELPTELRELVTAHLGSTVVSADVQGGGFSPGVAARLVLQNSDRSFVKAIPAAHVLAGKYLIEAETGERLPPSVPSPRLRWHGSSAGWVVLLFDDIDGRHADLSPGSADIPTVISALTAMADLLTPSPLPDLQPSSATRAGLLHGWGDLATSPPADLDWWGREHLSDLAVLEAVWPAHADGLTLVHGDIRPDNLLVASGGAYVVDWAQPSQGAAWQDIADLMPHLIMAGHSPVGAEKTLVGIPYWDLAPPEVITSYAAAYAGYWTRMSRQPSPPGVPNLRAYQRRAAGAAIAWTRYRTGW
ncbi:phosphotransferase [Microtetraspora sp. AC03309]|uniref:phosphotransferase family protein n=1 Tax=Microtetraspora sp. AC03309 TaxID=2779376 RepID=UPI001E5B4C77|nr:phosphotransferase [Microtetraspora sp. AC03309]MCC5580111.1 phosphotransferase [Microtetraspora sp. AC03309]